VSGARPDATNDASSVTAPAPAVSIPNVREMTPVSAQSFPMVHHHRPSANIAAGCASTFSAPPMPASEAATPVMSAASRR